ncbi:hypothetical protein F4824DRAFT_512054 [Ustulina deusta]|nr:hypothetical protein F4824DRAFT_512054 [Ustulina deusta]
MDRRLFHYEEYDRTYMVHFILASNMMHEELDCFGQAGRPTEHASAHLDSPLMFPPRIFLSISHGTVMRILPECHDLNITDRANQQAFSCVWPDLAPAWYHCDSHTLNENENRTHNYEVEASMRLVSSEEWILVNQTWYCDGERPKVKFLALGTVSLPSLKCRESLEVEADTADDTIPAGPPTMNDKVCFSPAFDINGQLEPRCAMEPYALELPNPEAPKCITISFDPGKQSFLLDTAYEGEPKFNLTILSFVTEPELGCSAFPSKPNPNGPDYDPDYWFGCSFSPSEPAFNRSMRADYNANTSLLAIVMSWSYDELSPQKPTAFGHGEISKPECADDSDGALRCLFPATSKIPILLTNVTWDYTS